MLLAQASPTMMISVVETIIAIGQDCNDILITKLLCKRVCILKTCKKYSKFGDCSRKLKVTLNDFSNVHISGLWLYAC